MSRRSTTRAPAKKPTVGARSLNRKAQAAQRLAARREQARGRARSTVGNPRRTRRLGALRRIPTAARVCFVVACLNAVLWSLLTPPFQGPDESDHFAYVQQLAENTRLPTSSQQGYSLEEIVALEELHYFQIRQEPQNHTIFSQAEQQKLQHDLSTHISRQGKGGAGLAASEPPLYYALQTIPYGVGSGATILDRLALMRLLSALMAGFTALFIFLFIREALPGVPWAWTVGALGVALAPGLSFISGSVNPDSMLYALSAAVFYCLARAFHRGLTRRLTIAIGAVMAIGFLTKLNFIGLAPGIVLGMLILTRRAARTAGRGYAYRSLALGLAVAGTPLAVYFLINVLSNHPSLGLVSESVHTSTRHGSLWGEIGFIWQYFLPRLPGMHTDFPGIFPLHQVWFDRLVGQYGWADTQFPNWVYEIALIPAAAIAILCARTLLASRMALRSRAIELVVYALMGTGVLVIVGASAYLSFPLLAGAYSESRYLLPMLALWGAVLALAARGAGRRWGPVVGVSIVVLIFAHDLFSQLLVVSRYYG
jgi:hypothetical protein